MTVSLLDKWIFLGAIMGDPTLPGSARAAAYFLLDHLNTQSERCDPSQIGLAERMGMSERSVVTGIGALITHGYFERVPGGGRGVRTRYRPCWETLKQASAFSDEETLKQSVINTEVLRQETLKQASDESGNRTREESENISIGDSAFEMFWRQYPRKVAKGAARRAHDKALKMTDANTILAGAMRYAAERAEENPRYTKHPGTWLIGECWNDEPTPTIGTNDGERTHGKRPSPHEALLTGAARAAHRDGD